METENTQSGGEESEVGYFNDPKIRIGAWSLLWFIVAVLGIGGYAHDIKKWDSDDADNDEKAADALLLIAMCFLIIAGICGMLYGFVLKELEILSPIIGICGILAGLCLIIGNCIGFKVAFDNYEDLKDTVDRLGWDSVKYVLATLVGALILGIGRGTYALIYGIDAFTQSILNNGKTRLTLYTLIMFVGAMAFGTSWLISGNDISDFWDDRNKWKDWMLISGSGAIIMAVGALIALITIYMLMSNIMVLYISSFLIFAGGLIYGVGHWNYLNDKPGDSDETVEDVEFVGGSFVLFFIGILVSYDLSFYSILSFGGGN